MAEWTTPTQILAEFFSLDRLGRAWKQVRRESRSVTIRDCIDFRDWTQDHQAALEFLRADLISGVYQPERPGRFEMPKSKGAFRLITVLGIRDAIVYRAIADAALEAASEKHKKVKGAFFSRRHAQTPVGDTFSLNSGDSSRFFDIWLRYNEYRTRSMLTKPYEFLVVSDISNYFDSIHHELLMEHLAPLGIPRPVISTLGRLLELLKPPAGHSPNPRVGIPVDEYDCSRQLAHLFLYEFDYTVCSQVGEDNYVRWMDDHNFGVNSLARAHAAVNEACRALACQRLTVNAGKTKILRPVDVVNHFALDINQELTRFENKWGGLFKDWDDDAKKDFDLRVDNWRDRAAETGVQDKILKRIYGLAAKVGSSHLDSYAYVDLLRNPMLSGRIFLSLAVRNEHEKLLSIFQMYVRQGHSLYDAVEAAFFDSLLRVSAQDADRIQIKKFCVQFAMGMVEGQSISSYGIATALIAAYWFGADSTSLLSLYDHDELSRLPTPALRSWLCVIRALSMTDYQSAVQKSAPVQSSDVAKLMRYMEGLKSGAVRNTRIDKSPLSNWPGKGKYIDARRWLIVEIYSNTQGYRPIRREAKKYLKRWLYYVNSPQEAAVADRIRYNTQSLGM